MFAGWGSWVARFRWPVLAVALVAVISAGVWGLGVFGQLSEGGYNDPNSESTRAGEVVQEAFGAHGGDLVAIYTPTKGKIDDAALGKAIRDRLAALPKTAVSSSTSYWNQKSAQYAAKDKSNAIALITLAGEDDGAKLDAYREIDDKFAVAGAEVQLAGAVVLNDASASRSTSDLTRAELISLPIVLVLLMFLFGSVVAASLPVLVGGAAVAGSLGILHGIASVHEVNSFAVNVASLLGLGMAIDYGLFMVGRFREEQAQGHPTAEAVRRTVATAGRTVVFSATLLMIALAGLLLFPQGFLQSLAYGGLAAVLLAAVLSLTLLPALLALLGPRVDKIPVRLPGRKSGTASSGWTKLAGFVLRRPVLVVIPILAGLVLLAAPIRGAHFGESDERILPAGDPARQAIETLQADYPQFTGDGVQIVLRGDGDSAGYAVSARQVPGIAQLTPVERAGDVALFTATLSATDPFSDEARDVVEALRAVPVPAGLELLVGGTTARNVDSLSATADRLPLMVGLLVGATLLLMFLAFGSVLLPIKAVVMSALSLSATFGLLVWIFQKGHGAGLLNVTPAPLEVGIVVLMAAVVFGLSTDYEVFLLSRMVEARSKGATTSEAVTTGLARTGRVISAAALLLIVVTGAFALSSVTTMRFVGVGMIIALLLDATVVRMLLVPAVLGLMGNAAWWAPGPLRRLQERAGLSEHAGEQAAGGRHAAALVATGAGASGGKPSWDRPPAELPALAGAAAPLALPAGSTDVTAVIPKVVDAEPVGEDSSTSSSTTTYASAAALPAAADASTSDSAATPDSASASASLAASNGAESGSSDAETDSADEAGRKPETSARAAVKPFGGLALPAAPVIMGTASVNTTPAGSSTPDEFFFSSASSTFGAPIEPPVIKPPTPWELPALTAGPSSPASDEPEPALDETRSLEAPDLDATQRLVPPDLADTRQMPAPLIRTEPSADAKPEPHLASAETSQRI
ncbi:MAG: efflux RND transporter permease subunit, partial [Actinoplanes sp.]